MKRAGVFLVSLLTVWTLFGPSAKAQEPEAPGLKVGTMAPDFTALTYENNTLTLSDHFKQGPVVLIFYRGAWCPYCSLHLRSFQERLGDFQKLGATVLAVSVDQQEYGIKIVQKEALGFDVISDPGSEILREYNVVFQVPDDLAQKYLDEYQIDLQAHSGRKDHVIAVPATYVIDMTGKIIFAYANTDYKTRTKPEEVLEVLKILK